MSRLLENIITIHIRADGPVSYSSIRKYVNLQYSESVKDYEILSELNHLLESGVIELYDGLTDTGGVAFSPKS